MATWTWANSNLTAATANCFASDTNGHIIAGANSDGVYYGTQSAPSVWTKSGDLSGITIVAVASTADGSAMFAATIANIYYSTNYGVNWYALSLAVALPPIKSICCFGTTGGYKVILATLNSTHSANIDNLTSTVTFYKSNDLDNADCTGIACKPDGTYVVVCVAGSYIYGSSSIPVSAGMTWAGIVGTAKPWTSVACSKDGSTFIACESGGTIWTFTSLAFIQQTNAPSGNSYNYVAISHTGTNLYACYPGGFAYSSNSGSTWNSDTRKTSLFAIHINPTGASNAGLPLLLGANVSTGRGIYYADYTVICFKEGTKILCLVDGVETYIPIETMTTNTLVKTSLDGYKKIELIGFSKLYNPGNTLKSLNRLYKCTPAKYPELTEDLIITGHHAILEKTITDKQRADLIDAMGTIYITDRKYRLLACVDDRAEPYTEEGVHTIWHFALENPEQTWNYGVYAHGLLVESCSIRTMRDLSGMTLLK